MATLTAGDLPVGPGVYALYGDGDRMYIGKADSLRDRVWKNHSGRGQLMTTSAMRRNIAEHLGGRFPRLAIERKHRNAAACITCMRRRTVR